jgi:hypothetical protein
MLILKRMNIKRTKEITLMKWNKQFEYPKSMRSLINDERHYEVGSEKLPSVTTILSVLRLATRSERL